jgi:hypothetical protein
MCSHEKRGAVRQQIYLRLYQFRFRHSPSTYVTETGLCLPFLRTKHCRTPSAKLQAATADAVEELTASGVPCKTSSAYLLLQLREQEDERPFMSHYGTPQMQPSAMSAPPAQYHMCSGAPMQFTAASSGPAAAAPAYYSGSMNYAASSELQEPRTAAVHEQQASSSSKRRSTIGGSGCKCKKSRCLKL